jgi:hypothetical protein
MNYYGWKEIMNVGCLNIMGFKFNDILYDIHPHAHLV